MSLAVKEIFYCPNCGEDTKFDEEKMRAALKAEDAARPAGINYADRPDDEPLTIADYVYLGCWSCEFDYNIWEDEGYTMQ